MNFIVAVDNNWAIGKSGGLLYSLPSDLKYFKSRTTGKVVVMGERTYLSLPKRPLPGRINIVLSDVGTVYDGATTVKNLQELKAEIAKYNTDDVYVIGGASVYNLLMDYCKLAYITKINASADADVYINNVDAKPNWRVLDKTEDYTENGLTFAFYTYINSNVKTL